MQAARRPYTSGDTCTAIEGRTLPNAAALDETLAQMCSTQGNPTAATRNMQHSRSDDKWTALCIRSRHCTLKP